MRTTIVAAMCSLVLLACNRQDGPPEPGAPDHAVAFTISAGGSAQLDVRIADSDAERERGLMGVEHLGADEGMAFVFDAPTDGAFWMKDTLIPLSIAFVDGSGAIVTVREMEPCEGDPCPTYGADAPYVLAVEANEGYFDRAGVGVGDRARLTETASG
ncbi:MAG: DUF192 domain-containing protein [Actinomycetota bacterium]